MTYSLLINGQPFLGGSILLAIAGGLIILAMLVLVCYMLWQKYVVGLRENEVLKYEFITIIAHKFRTPLSSMKWIIETLIKEEQDGFKKQSLTDMQTSNQKLIDLTGTLVELTDADSAVATGYQFEEYSLCDITRAVVATLKDRFHGKNQFVAVECPVDDVRVKIDRPRFEFVIQTLLENSNLYSPPGRNIQVGVVREGTKAILYVKDNGIGISAADLPRMFTKFYRSDGAKRIDTEGFGIALYLAKSIVDRHHGKIAIASPGQDKGTTVNITLPAAR